MAYSRLAHLAFRDESLLKSAMAPYRPDVGTAEREYAFPVTLLVDKEVIPEKLFTVLNLIYQPSVLRLNSKWQHDDSLIVIAGGSYAISPNLFFGAEVRHENFAQNGNLNAMRSSPAHSYSSQGFHRQNRLGRANSGRRGSPTRSHELSAPSGGVAARL